MADVTKVKASDGTIYDINDVNDYTKDETDALLAGKADVGDSYTKAEDDALLAAKADTSSVDSALALKANVVDVYSKTEADNLLAGKADVGVSYTKAEDDALLADKANSADVYTITQADALLDGKADIDDSSITSTVATWSASKLNVEFQGKADVGDSYTKAEDDALLNNKADVGDSYTKAEDDALLANRPGFPDLAHVTSLSMHGSSTASTQIVLQSDGWLWGYNASGSSTDGNIRANDITIGYANTSTSGYVSYSIPLKAGTVITWNNLHATYAFNYFAPFV